MGTGTILATKCSLRRRTGHIRPCAFGRPAERHKHRSAESRNARACHLLASRAYRAPTAFFNVNVIPLRYVAADEMADIQLFLLYLSAATGTDIAAATFDSLRRNIALASQETTLFDDTIRANIAYGRPGATRQEVESAAAMAHIREVIEGLPQGWESVVGERGLKLSGGEKQRVAIARAILKDPEILIFDEATSALDYESERIIQHNMQAICQERTVIIIAHRLSTVRAAQRILVMDKGQIVEQGSHDELLSQRGQYAHLHALQRGYGVQTVGK